MFLWYFCFGDGVTVVDWFVRSIGGCICDGVGDIVVSLLGKAFVVCMFASKLKPFDFQILKIKGLIIITGIRVYQSSIGIE